MASGLDLLMGNQQGGPATGLDALLSGGNQSALPPMTADPTDGMSTADKFLAGMGKAFTDVGRGAGQLVPVYRNGQWQTLVTRDDVADARKLDSPLMNTTAGKVGDVAGNLAAFAPAALVPGANTLVGSTLIGAASGALQPSTSTRETLTNIGVGGAAGAAIPATILAAKTAKSFIEPLYQGGRNQIVGRAISDAAGGDNAALVQALRSNQSAVPGVQYTAAEAANNPSIAALQRTATQTSPVMMNEAAARQAANNEARGTALQDLAGTQGQREFYDNARQAAANDLYERAYSVPIEMENLSPAMRGEATKLMQMPAVQDALATARTNAKNYGMDTTAMDGNIAGLHQAKLAMDDKIASLTGGTANQANAAAAIRAARDRLVTFMEKMSPDYADARTTYREMSKPINQMDTVQLLTDKSTNPLTGQLYPQAFARNLSDDTARSATGFKGATLENTLAPDAASRLNAIQEDLARQNFAQTAGKGAGSDTAQKLAYANMLRQSGMPAVIRNFGPAGIVGSLLERGGNIVYNDANHRLSEQLARALLNPNEAANLVTGQAVSPQTVRLANALRRSGAALGASAPALVQSSQQ